MKMKDYFLTLELEKQVTSLGLSKELKKLHVKQDSVFSWIEYPDGTFHVELTKYAISLGEKEKGLFAAFTVAEHGEALPGEISVSFGVKYYLDCGKIDSQSMYYVRYTKHDVHDTIHIENGNTEADVRAKMRIWLIKKKI